MIHLKGGIVGRILPMKLRKLPLVVFFTLLLITSCGLDSETILPTPSQTALPFPTQTATLTPTVIQPSPWPSPTATSPPPTAVPVTAEPTFTPTTSIKAGLPVTITEIQMQSATRGWSIGQPSSPIELIFHTKDSGSTWAEISPPEAGPGSDDLRKQAHLASIDSRRAWVTYDLEPMFEIPEKPVVYRTEDGGASWQASIPLDLVRMEEFYHLSDFHFSDLDHGWLLAHIGAGMNHDYIEIFHTANGGATWQRVADPLETPDIQGCSKTGMKFVGPDYGWLTSDCQGVVDGAFIDQSDDAGRTWSQIFLPAPKSEPDLFDKGYCWTTDPQVFSSTTGMLVMGCFLVEGPRESQSFIYFTEDAGDTWSTFPYPGGQLQMLNPVEGWALSNEIYRTEDGGRTWEKVKTVSWEGQFSFIDMELGWAVARADSEIALVLTDNGSRSWQMLEPTHQD